jgi:DNA-directed RNA polymerase specialized sigma54-like protein
MAKTTLTNSKALEVAIQALTDSGFNSEVIEKLTKIKASIDKKSNSVNKKKAAETESFKAMLMDFLGNNEPTNENGFIVTDIVNSLDGNYTNQKITSILTKLVADNLVERSVVKGTSYYNVVA